MTWTRAIIILLICEPVLLFTDIEAPLEFSEVSERHALMVEMGMRFEAVEDVLGEFHADLGLSAEEFRALSIPADDREMVGLLWEIDEGEEVAIEGEFRAVEWGGAGRGSVVVGFVDGVAVFKEWREYGGGGR